MRALALLGPFVLLLVIAQGCETPPGPTTGAIQLITQTTGGDRDLDGYLVVVDSVQHVMAIDTSLIVPELATGVHVVTLTGLAANCDLAPAVQNIQSALVRAGDTADVVFPVICVATGLRVSALTSGLDPDANGYFVTVDGVVRGDVNASTGLEVTRLVAGVHTVTLGNLADNCTISGPDTLSVDVVARSIAQVPFEVSCMSTSGVITASTTTTGVELDANGYRIAIDSLASFPIAVNGTVQIPGVSVGAHRVSVIDRASNCSVAPEHPRTVTIEARTTARDTASVAFAINCVATRGSIRIATVTSGTDLDPDGYSVLVDEDCSYYYSCYAPWSAVVASNGEHVFTDIPVGQHSISVQEMARNCSLAGSNPRTANVEAAATAVVTLDVTCFKTGSVAVTVTTVGVDLDGNGYGVSLSGPTPDYAHVAANETVTFATLIPGGYQVQLTDVAINCVVTGPHPRPVMVTEGAQTSVALDVTCSQARQLALVSERDGNPEIYLVKETGSGLIRLTMNSVSDLDPAWSPDGSKIAFSSNRAGNYAIYVMNPDGSNQIRLTNTAAANDVQPTWSPDGSKIAFSSNLNGATDLYVMNADGSSVLPLTTDGAAAVDADPDWSPTGIIAFQSTSGGRVEIWVMDADGGNRRQLTTTNNNYEPSWSPDGSKLTYRHDLGCGYYGCDYDLYIINADGSGNVAINNDVNAVSPDWSPDGQAIAFTLIDCSYYYYYCDNGGIGMMHPDGLGFRQIVIATTYSPAWRPGN